MLLMALIILLDLSLQSIEVRVAKLHVGILAFIDGLAPLVKMIFVGAAQGIDALPLALFSKTIALFASLFRLPVEEFVL